MNENFLTPQGRTLKFNDHVVVEGLAEYNEEERTGRLLQVRVGCGQFGSCVYLIRLRDGRLKSFENVMVRRVDDESFIDAFYRSNGVKPPVVPDQPIFESDTPDKSYTIMREWSEKGFVIEDPKQPQTPGSFGVTIINK